MKIMIKTIDNFNEKWGNYLEQGHYGMAIENLLVIDYLDNEFEKEIQDNLTFSYSQIKLKFGMAIAYASSKRTTLWEKEINKILSNTEPAIIVNEN